MERCIRKMRSKGVEVSRTKDINFVIKSEISNDFLFPAKGQELQETIEFFVDLRNDEDCFGGKGRRGLLGYYEDTLPEANAFFSEMSDEALQYCNEFEDFCQDVVEYEVLRLVEDGKPLSLAIMGKEITFTRH